MGRGSSKAGGGGGGAVQQAINPNAPFSNTDPTTWAVGTEVQWSGDDIGAADGRIARRTYNQEGVITEVHPDHLIATDDMGVTYWVDTDSSMFRAKSSASKAIPTSQVKVSVNGTAPNGYGHYGFTIGGKKVWFDGDYAGKAKPNAIKYAAALGIKNITL